MLQASSATVDEAWDPKLTPAQSSRTPSFPLFPRKGWGNRSPNPAKENPTLKSVSPQLSFGFRVYQSVTMQTRMRNFVFAFLAVLLTLSPAGAQSGSFVIAQNGKAVGTASFSFVSTPSGYNSTSTVRVAMQGLNYTLSKTESLSAANHLRHAQVSATVNSSAVNLTVATDTAQFLLNVSADGKSSTTRLALHPAAVFLPDFDPGALETLLALAVSHNNAGLWAIIPKQSGDQAGSIAPIQLATYADEQGALDGKPIAVHHLVSTIAGSRSELFSGPENQLLQAELPQQGFALVRNGFILTPPAKPGAPPVEPQAAPQGPAAPNPVQQ